MAAHRVKRSSRERASLRAALGAGGIFRGGGGKSFSHAGDLFWHDAVVAAVALVSKRERAMIFGDPEHEPLIPFTPEQVSEGEAMRWPTTGRISA